MLTSAGGILALLKDQNQVLYRLSVLAWEMKLNLELSGGATKGPVDSVRAEEAGLGGRRVLGWDFRLNPNYWGEIVASNVLEVESKLAQVVSEDDIYPAEVRQQAALVASKVLSLIIVESCCILYCRCTTILAPTRTPCSTHWGPIRSLTSRILEASECRLPFLITPGF